MLKMRWYLRVDEIVWCFLLYMFVDIFTKLCKIFVELENIRKYWKARQFHTGSFTGEEYRKIILLIMRNVLEVVIPKYRSSVISRGISTEK